MPIDLEAIRETIGDASQLGAHVFNEERPE